MRFLTHTKNIFCKGEILLVLVSKEQYESLKKAGLINYSKARRNFRQTGRGKPAKRRKFYVVESKKILQFLGITPKE